MKSLFFEVELLEDAAISADTTSTGSHASLPFIPGAKFLGVCAEHYESFPGWDVFHSGRVRFGNAYPSVDGVRSRPIPKTWTEGMGEADGPLKPYRNGFFVGKDIVIPRRVRRQKTAMNRQRRGAALDHSFFDISALGRGQRFMFELSFDPKFEKEAERLGDILTAGPVTIGRSRGAEFGLMNILPIRDTNSAPVAISAGADQLTFFLDSDLDPGLSTELNPALFGLDNSWAFVEEESCISHRKTVGFNSHRRLFTTHKVVLERGSIVVFVGGPLDQSGLTQVTDRLKSGVGGSLAEGFGAVLLNPAFLAGSYPKKPESKLVEQKNAPDDRLYLWAKRRAERAGLDREALQLARDTLESFTPLLRAARAESKLSNLPLKELRPSRSQWSALRDVAQSTHDIAEMDARLFGKESGLTTTGQFAKAWSFGIRDFSFREGLCAPFRKMEIDSRDDRDRLLRLYLLHLSVEASRRLDREETT